MLNIILIEAAIIIVFILLFKGQIKKIKDLKNEVEDEKERSLMYEKAMKENNALIKARESIDQGIRDKKNERDKMSKADKIKLANSRT